MPAEIDRNADKLAERWFIEQRKAIKNLSDERQASYREIKGMSRDPQQVALQRPRTRSEDTQDADGLPLPTRKLHLLSECTSRIISECRKIVPNAIALYSCGFQSEFPTTIREVYLQDNSCDWFRIFYSN